MVAAVAQLAGGEPADRRLPGAGQPREPEAEARARARRRRERAVRDRAEVGLAAVKVEGAEAAEQPVVRTVIVRRPRHQQPQLLAALRQKQRLLARVRGVEDLDAIEPGGAVAVNGRAHLAAVLDVPERMRPDGHPGRLVNPRDRLLDGGMRARHVAGLALNQVRRDERGDIRVPLFREPFGVGRVSQDRSRQVRPPDRLAGRLARLDRSGVDLEAELAEPLRHRVGAALAVRARVEQPLAQQGAAVVDPVAEHVQVLVLAVDGRDLGGRDHPDAVHGARGERLVHAVDRVVVGQREQLHPGQGGVLDHLGRRAARRRNAASATVGRRQGRSRRATH